MGAVNNSKRWAPSGIAHVAQLVEHFLGKEEVISSILIMGSSSVNIVEERREDIWLKVNLKERDRKSVV